MGKIFPVFGSVRITCTIHPGVFPIHIQSVKFIFFDKFNELNEIDEFDVYCEKSASTYSRVKRRRCWSPFERQIDEDEQEYAFLTGGRVGMRNEGLIRAKRKQQAEHLQKMVLENPELQALYLRYGNANVEFETERDRRCSGKLLCSGPDEDEAAETEE